MTADKKLIENSHVALNKLLKIDASSKERKSDIWTFSVQHTAIMFPAFEEGLQTIATAHKRYLTSGAARGVFITGQSGSGKTTLLERYAAQFPRYDGDDRTYIPVLYVITPSRPSVKFLAKAILVAMGAPYANQAGEESTEDIIALLAACGTQLLCIDEIHHTVTALDKREFNRVTEWLKTIMNRAKIPLITAGLPRSIQLLQLNEQLKRRMATQYYLRPFSFHDQCHAIEFKAVLSRIQKSLPLACIALDKTEIAQRFYFATNGLIDYVARILDGAIVDCLLKSQSEISLSDLAEAFAKHVWPDVPDGLNPFTARIEKLRPLTQGPEPFSTWDDPASYQAKSTTKKYRKGA